MMTTTKINQKIIAISSPANYGKTSVIRYVHALLTGGYVQEAALQQAVLQNNDEGLDDVCGIFTIRGIKVGITSRGDPDSILEECLQKLVNEGCQLIICATRTSGSTVHAVIKYDGNTNSGNNIARDLENIYMIEWQSPPTLQNPNVFGNAVQEINRANERSALNIFTETQEFIYINGN